MITEKEIKEYRLKNGGSIQEAKSYLINIKKNNISVDDLLKALKTIEWGRVPGKSMEWATSEQLRDIAREAITKATQ